MDRAFERGGGSGGEGKDVAEMVSLFKKNFTIRVDEEEKRVAEEGFRNSVVAKLMSERGYNKQPFMRTMAKAWKVKESGFAELAGVVFLVKLRSETEQYRIINGGPWNFMNQLVAVRRWEAGVAPFEYNFAKCSIWIQVHNLPSEYLEGDGAASMAVKCGSNLGKLPHYFCAESNQRKFLRIRVEVNIKEPLCPGTTFERNEKEPLWLEFKYERLPFLCYNCGKMGHETRFCKEEQMEAHKGLFGPWMRAGNGETGGVEYGSDKEGSGIQKHSRSALGGEGEETNSGQNSNEVAGIGENVRQDGALIRQCEYRGECGTESWNKERSNDEVQVLNDKEMRKEGLELVPVNLNKNKEKEGGGGSGPKIIVDGLAQMNLDQNMQWTMGPVDKPNTTSKPIKKYVKKFSQRKQNRNTEEKKISVESGGGGGRKRVRIDGEPVEEIQLKHTRVGSGVDESAEGINDEVDVVESLQIKDNLGSVMAAVQPRREWR